MRPLPNTKAAIDAYDAFNEAFNTDGMNNDEVLAAFAELERMAKAVGRVFGEETSDINSPVTCEQVIRPGHKVPGPGCELSFVRRMVALGTV